MSLSKLSKNYGNGLSRQMIHYYFKMFDLKTRPLKRHKTVSYRKEKYAPGKDGYLRKTKGDRELLHRQKWKDKYGPIEDGYEIMFKDGDRKNCSIENLEKISTSDHAKLCSFGNNQHAKGKNQREKILLKPCLNCAKTIPDKGYGPAYYKNRDFCSLACKHEYDDKMGNTIGIKKVANDKTKKFLVVVLASLIYSEEIPRKRISQFLL